MENKISICPVCSRRCVLSAEVEGDSILSLRPMRGEGFEGCAEGFCVKGAHGDAYRRRADRLTRPLRRVGEKGEGRFEEISWEEAITEIAERLLAIRENCGADAVAFFSGYTKWLRPMLKRFACSFGSVNYGTESSSCQRSAVMANICDTGLQSRPDCKNAGLLLVTARRKFSPAAKAAARAGMKIIAVDPNLSPDIAKYADLHLRLRPGTDVALAYGIARELILAGKADGDYIEKYVHGFEAYKERAMLHTPELVERICGVAAEDLKKAAAMIGENLPMALHEGFSGLIHHTNGMQAVRAWNALTALTGCYGRPGGNLPTGRLLRDGYPESTLRLFDFEHPRALSGLRAGGRRFPLWNALMDECQAMDFPEAAGRGELKAIFAMGMNARMFPDSPGFFKMLKGLDFFVDCDIWLSDSAKYADIVLPVSISYEREQTAFVAGDSRLLLTRPIVAAPGLCRSDEDIIFDLARAMDLEDELLQGGREACWDYILGGAGLSLEAPERETAPMPIPRLPAPKPLEEGFPTPSGRFELWSEAIAAAGLEPLPRHIDPFEGDDRDAYPLHLLTGIRSERYAHVLHSRCHSVAPLRAIRPRPTVDMHPDDAAALGIEKSDTLRLVSPWGSLLAAADIDSSLLPGCVNMYHGYPEADVNSLFPADRLDPYSGFPAYKALPCRVEKI